MKPIKIIIISIFLLSAVLSALLYIQKSGRISDQMDKKSLGWNPVAIKKMMILRSHHDTLVLTKSNGVWKSNAVFDGMGISQQLLVYLSTLKIENSNIKQGKDYFKDPILLHTYDKNAKIINSIIIGEEISKGTCIARLNDETVLKLLHSDLNRKSLRSLLIEIL